MLTSSEREAVNAFLGLIFVFTVLTIIYCILAS